MPEYDEFGAKVTVVPLNDHVPTSVTDTDDFVHPLEELLAGVSVNPQSFSVAESRATDPWVV